MKLINLLLLVGLLSCSSNNNDISGTYSGMVRIETTVIDNRDLNSVSNQNTVITVLEDADGRYYSQTGCGKAYYSNGDVWRECSNSVMEKRYIYKTSSNSMKVTITNNQLNSDGTVRIGVRTTGDLSK
ncbi:hypothetical protein PQY73_01510 [Schleiferiaceae bacterium]|nr:hypothetical protein [Schleiferiaceae bacterium]